MDQQSSKISLNRTFMYLEKKRKKRREKSWHNWKHNYKILCKAAWNSSCKEFTVSPYISLFIFVSPLLSFSTGFNIHKI